MKWHKAFNVLSESIWKAFILLICNVKEMILVVKEKEMLSKIDERHVLQIAKTIKLYQNLNFNF